MAAEGAHQLATAHIPQLHGLIVTARGQPRAIRTEGHRRDRVGMAQLQEKFDGSISESVRRDSTEGEKKHKCYDGPLGGYHGHSPWQERRSLSLTTRIVEASLNIVKQLNIPKVIALPGI